MSVGSNGVSPHDLIVPVARRQIAPPTPMREFDGVAGGIYRLVQTIPQFEAFLELAMGQRSLAVDTETSGLNWVHADVCGIVVGWGIANNYYFPIAHKTDEKQLGVFDVLPGFHKLFGRADTTKIFANAKFDLHGLRKLGLEVNGVIHDIVVLAHLLDENADHGVKEMSVTYIHPDCAKWDDIITEWRVQEARRRRTEFSTKSKARAEDMMQDQIYQHRAAKLFDVSVVGLDKKLLRKACSQFAKEEMDGLLCSKNKKDDVTYDYIPLQLMTPYACADVHYTWLLFKMLVTRVAAHDALKRLYANEMALTRVLFDSEHGGVRIDIPYLQQIQPEFEDEARRLEKEVYAAVGYEFNIGSAQQLVEALQKAGVQLTKLSKGSKEMLRSGDKSKPLKYSVDKEVLEGLGAKYPFADLVLKFRNLEKLKSTYVENIQDLVDDKHYLHSDTNQNVTTGRMSMREPNLQNIPARNKAIRRAFVVPDTGDFIFVFMDYSQVELRLTADRSQDPTLLGCYPFVGKGADVHTITLADVVLSLPLIQVQEMKVDKAGHIDKPQRGEACNCRACQYDFYRNIAKRVNFGIIYGAGPAAIQRQVSTPTRFVDEAECEEYIKKYFLKYPGVKSWIMSTQQFMKTNGFVQNSFGRYRQLKIERGMQKWEIERMCRQGVNFLIQGEAADLFKTAAVRVDALFKKVGARSRLVNFVHDELQFYWHKDELSLLPEVKKAMEDFHYTVPIVAEISYSKTDWGSKKELKAA